MSQAVAFIGLGLMGRGMAANLLKAGYILTVHNRTAAKAAELLGQGARWADSAAAAVTPGAVLVTMLADDHAVEEVVMGGAGERLGQGGLHIGMSTISPETSRRLQAWHAARGSTYVSAPVFGRPAAAAAAKLWVMQAGDAPARERARPLLQSMSQGVFDFGDDAGKANVVKLCGNFLIASIIEALSETLTLAQKNGIERKAVSEFLTSTVFNTPVFQSYAPIVAAMHAESIGFELRLGYKDMRLIRDCAEAAAVPMPLASVVRERFLSSLAKGRGDMDWSAICLAVAEEAGLDPGAK